MISTADAVVFDPAEIEWRQAVLAKCADQTDFSCQRAKKHQVLAQQSNAQRFGARLGKKRSRDHRDPVLAKEIAHQCTRTDAAQLLVFFTAKGKSANTLVVATWCCHRTLLSTRLCLREDDAFCVSSSSEIIREYQPKSTR